jgi:RNA polymerase sigma factor (sigma-70 family)
MTREGEIMAGGQLDAVMRRLRHLAEPWGAGGLSDAQLLERWVAGRDEAAFEVLVWRHGPMVLNVCRRVVHQPCDAEDAFQAAFLTLVRKAGTIGKRASVASWLYKVAFRAALAANARAANRSAHERQHALDPAATPPDADVVWRDLRPILDAEVNALPDKYRTPFVLCYLEGRTVAEAARQLGWPRGTVGSRLAWARERLRQRLTRRGVTLSAAALATALARGTTAAAFPAALVATANKVGVLSTAGGTAASGIPSSVLTLAKEVGRGLAVSKLKAAACLVLGLVLLVTGVTFTARQILSAGEPAAPVPERSTGGARATSEKTPRDRADRYGDPLPPAALARMGTVRFRHGNSLHALALSPNGKILGSGGGNALVCLWDLASGKLLHRLKGHRGMVLSVAFSPNGKAVATGGNDNSIRIWEVNTGRLLHSIKPDVVNTQALAYSPNGKWLAAGGTTNVIQFWDPDKGTLIRRLFPKEGRARKARQLTGVNALVFTADSRRLYSGGWGGHGLREWDPQTARELRPFLSAGRRLPIKALALSRDGNTLASGGASGDNTIRLWDVKKGQETRQLTRQAGEVGSLAFSPDGQTLASGGGWGNPTLVLWDVKKGKERRRLGEGDNPVGGLLFGRGGKTLVAGMGACVRVWKTATGKELYPFGGHHAYVGAVALSPNGRTLATAGGDRTLRLWDVDSAKEVKQLKGHQGPVAAMALSPNGKYLVSGGYDDPIRLWDVARGKEVPGFQGRRVPTRSVAFSPDGRLVAAGEYYRGAVYLWKTATGALVKRLPHPDGVMTIAFSPDGKWLAAGSGIGGKKDKPAASIRLFQVATGRELYQIKGNSYWTWGLAFSPDSRVLASAGSDQGIALWSVATGKELRRLGKDLSHVNALVFSPDGRTLAASSGLREETIHLWEMATGHERLRLSGHRDSVLSLSFSRDGRTLASGSSDTTALVWDVTGLRTGAKLEPLTVGGQERFWAALARPDALRAYRAVWGLAGRGKETVRFLEKRLRPVAAVDGRQVERRIADLSSRRFAVRKRAMRELEQWAELAEPALRKALAANPSLEARQRLEKLLKKLTSPWGERLRAVRAVEVLEDVGGPEARRLLAALARGEAAALLTREAKAALERFSKKAVKAKGGK